MQLPLKRQDTSSLRRSPYRTPCESENGLNNMTCLRGEDGRRGAESEASQGGAAKLCTVGEKGGWRERICVLPPPGPPSPVRRP
ncbi:hypothetical protein HPB50_005879 [Hyalomma asiaticum]|uniref:Uncharacterized protein n=1 Tax=Hyalomma asiaticum TaxID=266040 RepID=A0ACB7S3R8_HYAAI|nr:hypothetical protein HPB50_005879 [Hyalomma asiaticum]